MTDIWYRSDAELDVSDVNRDDMKPIRSVWIKRKDNVSQKTEGMD